MDFYEKRKSFTAPLDFKLPEPNDATNTGNYPHDHTASYHCTIIFNGNAVLSKKLQSNNRIRTRTTTTTTTTIVSRNNDNVDTIKYSPGYVTVESGNLNNGDSVRSRSKYRQEMNDGNLKKGKYLTRSIYLPSSKTVKPRPKSINLDDFERNSILTISYYGENDPYESNFYNNYDNDGFQIECNSSCDFDPVNTSTYSTEFNLNVESHSSAEIYDDEEGDVQYLPENKQSSHSPGNNFVFNSSAEDLAELREVETPQQVTSSLSSPKETTTTKKKRSASIERSYVPYKPKDGDKLTEKVTNFATEIIMKPKEAILEKVEQTLELNEKNEENDLPQDFDLEDENVLKKVEEMAKARAAIPKKVGNLVKMF